MAGGLGPGGGSRGGRARGRFLQPEPPPEAAPGRGGRSPLGKLRRGAGSMVWRSVFAPKTHLLPFPFSRREFMAHVWDSV